MFPVLLAALALTTPPTVAVVDSGITPIPQLAATLAPGIDLTGSGSTADWYGHGTEMASIIHAECPSCRLMPVKTIGQSGYGTADATAEGISWAAQHGARIINLSLTSPADNPAVDQAITEACNQGVTVVVAAGNDGASHGYPAETAPCSLAVGSKDHGVIRPFSNRGPWVDLWAPGQLPCLTSSGDVSAAVGTSASAAYTTGLYAELEAEGDPHVAADAAAFLGFLTG